MTAQQIVKDLILYKQSYVLNELGHIRSDKRNQRIRHEITEKYQTERTVENALAELEKRKRDIFWDAEYAMLSTGIKYFNTCSEYWLYKLENEYITAENEYLNSQE